MSCRIPRLANTITYGQQLKVLGGSFFVLLNFVVKNPFQENNWCIVEDFFTCTSTIETVRLVPKILLRKSLYDTDDCVIRTSLYWYRQFSWLKGFQTSLTVILFFTIQTSLYYEHLHDKFWLKISNFPSLWYMHLSLSLQCNFDSVPVTSSSVLP